MKFFKGKVCLAVVVFSFLVLCASLALAREDRDAPRRHDPEREYRECRERCQVEEEGRRPQQVCEDYCEKQRIEREREERRWGDDIVDRKRSEEEEEEEFGGKSGWPYVFDDQHFSTKYKGQQGRVRVLERFNQRSRLLKGIRDYRVMIFESQPQTFVVPNHLDADALLFVAQGKGTLSLVYPDRRDSFNIERGHVMVLPAGVTAYLINRGNNDKLVIVKLINPVTNTGNFEQFFGPGGQSPESFFNAFSSDILEAAFKSSGDKLQRLFSKGNEGAIIRASEEQIRALTHEKSGHWPFAGKGSSPYNLLKRQPKESNEFGSLYEVDSDDYKQLENLNVAVSFGNLTQGSMHTPFYNSRATIITVVLRGKGRFEMACPHVSKSGHRQHDERHESGSRGGGKSTSPVHYEKINSYLRQGTVVVIPPGHPFVTVASNDENLETICFEVNAENNHKVPLAGQRSVYKNLEREAKELAFADSADVVDDVLRSQDEEFFFRGPREQDPRRGYSII